MRKPILAILALILASLACGQQIVPTPTPTAAPTATEEARHMTATADASPAPLPDPTQITAQVVAARLRVREGPGTEYPAKEEHLFAGQDVTILEYSGDWVRIAEPAGWVFRGCVSDNPNGLKCEAAP